MADTETQEKEKQAEATPAAEAPKEEKENMMTKVRVRKLVPREEPSCFVRRLKNPHTSVSPRLQVKAAGVAGLVSYALWEFAFWTISVPLGTNTKACLHLL